MRIFALVVTGAALVLAGCGGDGAGVAAPTVTETVTVTVTHTPAPVAEPEPAASEWSSSPAMFKVGIKVLEKKCFGSAGCNVTFRIEPEYLGTVDLPSDGTVEVFYEVKGGEDPLLNNFTIEDGQASYDSEERIQTASSDDELTGVVTSVDYSP